VLGVQLARSVALLQDFSVFVLGGSLANGPSFLCDPFCFRGLWMTVIWVQSVKGENMSKEADLPPRPSIMCGRDVKSPHMNKNVDIVYLVFVLLVDYIRS
jgi:hypothetical protein